MPDLANPIISKPEVPEKIQAYYLSNNVDTFQFDRRLHKLVVEDPDNEFKVSTHAVLIIFQPFVVKIFNYSVDVELQKIPFCLLFRTCGSNARRCERLHHFLVYCRGLKL